MSTIAVDLHITDAEWEVMRVVWANGRVEKGALNTEQEGRKYIYSANIEEKETVRSFTNDIFDRICRKNVGNVVGSIIEDHVLSFDDIQRLEEILEMKKAFAVEEVDCQCTEGQCECHLHHHGE